MDEVEYVDQLLARYPSEGEETSNETLALVEEALRAFPTSSKLWCIRGDLIQLGSGEGYELEDALLSYKEAASVDPDCAEAYEGLGYFYDLVMDDEEKAKPFFQRATLLKREDGT